VLGWVTGAGVAPVAAGERLSGGVAAKAAVVINNAAPVKSTCFMLNLHLISGAARVDGRVSRKVNGECEGQANIPRIRKTRMGKIQFMGSEFRDIDVTVKLIPSPLMVDPRTRS
jgi:hypothetical protein